jgi:hypothetical protein
MVVCRALLMAAAWPHSMAAFYGRILQVIVMAGVAQVHDASSSRITFNTSPPEQFRTDRRTTI